MSRPSRPADAVIIGPTDADFWTRHPDVRHVEHLAQKDEIAEWDEWSVWLVEPANDDDQALKKWLGERRPDRLADLVFENAGRMPPLWFWQRHPDVTAFAVEFDPADGLNWWSYIWTGAL